MPKGKPNLKEETKEEQDEKKVEALSYKWEEIIYLFSGHVPPCFYAFVRYLLKAKELRVSRFLLPYVSEAQASEMLHEYIIPPRIHSHCKYQAPRICSALYNRGYTTIEAEVPYRSGKADLLGRNDQGQSIVVEVGSLSKTKKIFVTRDDLTIRAFWLVPQVDYVYTFIAERGDHPAWDWHWKKIDEIVEDFRNRYNIVRGAPCSEFSTCKVRAREIRNRPCYQSAQTLRHANYEDQPASVYLKEVMKQTRRTNYV